MLNAGQGQFPFENRYGNTPYVKKLRMASTATCSLKD